MKYDYEENHMIIDNYDDDDTTDCQDEIIELENKIEELELRDKPMKVIKTPQERLFYLGFEKVAKHKFVKVNKGGSGYDTPYKITIEIAFNMYQVKCECENWVGVNLELAEILVDYLKELENE